MTNLSQGFWIFIGIIVGIIVNFVTQKLINLRNERNILKNFKFEIKFNIKKINKYLEYLNEFKDLINGDSLEKFAKYFDLTKTVMSTTNYMLYNGLLYKYLSDNNVGIILVFISQFGNPFWEDLINKQISIHINNFKTGKSREEINKKTPCDTVSIIGTTYYSKNDAFTTFLYWKNFFDEQKKNLEDIQKSLK